jgi:hypothetical protein
MVVEKFRDQNATQVYRRAQEKGRMLPDGLHYVDSWVSSDFDRCFQLMKTEDPKLFHIWIEKWEDLVDFEVIQVAPSKEASKIILNNPI